MGYIRILKIITYIGILIFSGYFIFQEFGWGLSIAEVLLLISPLLFERIRKLIFGEKKQGISNEHLEHKDKLKYSDLDPEFEHVYAIFFYPKNVSWKIGERTPLKNNPRYKYIINRKTHKAFYMMEYAMCLLKPKGKITWQSETFTSIEDSKKFLKNKNIRLIETPATESNLLATETLPQKLQRWYMLIRGTW